MRKEGGRNRGSGLGGLLLGSRLSGAGRVSRIMESVAGGGAGFQEERARCRTVSKRRIPAAAAAFRESAAPVIGILASG